MDADRFDAMTRRLAGISHRRSFLKSLVGATAGVAALAGRGTDAVCSPGGWYCQRNSDCCSGSCGAASRNGRNRVCTACVPKNCETGDCGSVPNGCGGMMNCGDTCAGCQSCDAGRCTDNAGLCDDSKQCTRNVCTNGACSNPPLDAGQDCEGGVCDGAGNCDLCAGVNAACTAHADCCSGICQGGSCVATVQGTCPDPVSQICAGLGPCGNSACFCIDSGRREMYCSESVICVANCSACAAGSICIPAGTVCCQDGQAQCVTPCSPDSCFTGETLVALADGTSRRIEAIGVGDALLGQDGHVNRVVAIKSPRLGSQRLYSLNGGDFFVTADHPFLTEDGWKSIDPKADALERRAITVGRLKVGDRLLVLAGVLTPAGFAFGPSAGVIEAEYKSVLLEKVESQTADPDTRLYDLILDGNHTFIANDLLVHNKA